MNKKQKKLRNKILLLGGLILIIFLFVKLNTLSFINVSSVDYVQTKVLNDQSNYIELEHVGIRNKPLNVQLDQSDCMDGKTYFSINLPVLYQGSKKGYPIVATEFVYWDNGFKTEPGWEWVNEISGESFPAESAYVNGIELNDMTGNCKVGFERWLNEANYVVDPSNFRNDRYGYNYYLTLNCNAKGWIPCDINNYANIYSVKSKSIKVNIPKDASIQCLDNSWCEDGFKCSSNQCIEDSNVITVYRIQDNKCVETILIDEDKLSTDFDNLNDCKESLSTGGYSTSSFVIIGILLIIVLGGILYLRKK